jgi:hypothetical protein
MMTLTENVVALNRTVHAKIEMDNMYRRRSGEPLTVDDIRLEFQMVGWNSSLDIWLKVQGSIRSKTGHLFKVQGTD